MSGTTIDERVALGGRDRGRAGGGGRWGTAAAAVLMLGALAAPAQAVVNEPPAAPHAIVVFPARDFISAEGYASGQSVTVEVARNGTVIGSAPSLAASDGLVEVNHPAPPGEPQNCWSGVTPDILPGDVVRILTAPDVGDRTTTANVTAQQAALVNGDVVVHGTARDAAGNPLPIGELEQRIIAFGAQFAKNGTRRLQAPGDGTLAYDPGAGNVNWTARYVGLPNDDKTLAVNSETRILWLGAGAPVVPQGLTIFETPVVGGPAPPCQAPLAQSALTNVDRSFVNGANVGTDMTVSGVVQDGLGVDVAVPGFSAPATIDPPNASGQRTWNATVPASALAALAEGGFQVTATFTGAGAPAPSARTLTKDTVSPPAPTASPAPGAYSSSQSVTLDDADATATIRYTNNGSTPSASSLAFGGPIPVTASQALEAIALDPAGNASPVATFDYVIAPAAESPGGSGGGGGGAAGLGAGSRASTGDGTGGAGLGDGIPAPGAGGLGLRGLFLSGRQRLGDVRRHGIRVVMRLPEGTEVVELRVFRITGGGAARAAARVQIAGGFRAPTAGTGLYRLRLRDRALRRQLRAGRYELEARPGRSRTQLGPASRYAFSILR